MAKQKRKTYVLVKDGSIINIRYAYKSEIDLQNAMFEAMEEHQRWERINSMPVDKIERWLETLLREYVL